MHRLLLIPLSLAPPSCASRTPPEPKPTSQPGVTPLLDAAAIWKQYDCNSKKLPFIVIEQEEIAPPSVQAGKEFQHRFVYGGLHSQRPTADHGERQSENLLQESRRFPGCHPQFRDRAGPLGSQGDDRHTG